MIPKEEYFEIKDVLRHRVFDINHSNNSDRIKHRELNSKYGQPNVNSFGWMPAISLCYSFDIDNDQILYMVPYLTFYNSLVYHLPQAIIREPDLFGTGNAKDVISALYHVSRYDKIGRIDDYQQFLIDNACCYFLLRKANREISNKIFRLDLFRHILPNSKHSYDFCGGLMHAYCHCSWQGKKLSSGNGETSMNYLWDLPVVLGRAILTADDSEDGSVTFEDDNRIWQIKYHIDPETKVYYLKTAFAKSV